MAFKWKDLAYKIEKINLCRKSFEINPSLGQLIFPLNYSLRLL